MVVKYNEEEIINFVKLYYQNTEHNNVEVKVIFVKSNMQSGHNKYVPAICVTENLKIGTLTKRATSILTNIELQEILNNIHNLYDLELTNIELVGANYKLTGNSLKEAIATIERIKKESLNR